MIDILLADDHTIVRKGLKQLLEDAKDFDVAGEAADGFEVLAKIRERDWGVLVLDLSMPGKSGVELIKQIKSEKPALPILVLTMHQEDQYAVRALRAGASGYLTKESAPELLVTAIRKVAAGGKYVSPTLAEKLVDEIGGGDRALHEALSDREFEIMRLIALGKSLTAIGEDLHISVKTVSTYRTRIIEKTGLRTNAELTQYMINNGLLT
jgi:two-component system, NarL family, invasion response regulator UvrY